MKKYIIFAFLIVSIPLTLAAQEKLSKAEKREQRKKERLEQAKALDKFLQKKQFVLEADMLHDKYGNTYNVSSMFNFIMLDGDQAVIQIGNSSSIGYNGVGGITIEGRVTDYKYSGNVEKGRFNISMNVTGSAGHFNVIFFLSPGGNANATVSASTTGGEIKYTGDLKSMDLSRVYKGMPRY